MLTALKGWLVLTIMAPIMAMGLQKQSTTHSNAMDEPVFRNDGQLVFLKHGTGSLVKMIQIEIAANEPARTQGLMWRMHMPDDDGMLFIFDKQEPLTFWMKNTYISLDMVFADTSGNIISIYPEAAPLSEASISSGGSAKYVVELNADFCERYGINVGDKIEFER